MNTRSDKFLFLPFTMFRGSSIFLQQFAAIRKIQVQYIGSENVKRFMQIISENYDSSHPWTLIKTFTSQIIPR